MTFTDKRTISHKCKCINYSRDRMRNNNTRWFSLRPGTASCTELLRCMYCFHITHLCLWHSRGWQSWLTWCSIPGCIKTSLYIPVKDHIISLIKTAVRSCGKWHNVSTIKWVQRAGMSGNMLIIKCIRKGTLRRMLSNSYWEYLSVINCFKAVLHPKIITFV